MDEHQKSNYVDVKKINECLPNLVEIVINFPTHRHEAPPTSTTRVELYSSKKKV